MSGLYVLRDTGSGAYIDGPFKRGGSAQERVKVYRASGWSPVVVRADSRAEALRKFEQGKR